MQQNAQSTSLGKESSIIPGVYRGNAIKFASGLVSYIEAQTKGIATVPFRQMPKGCLYVRGQSNPRFSHATDMYIMRYKPLLARGHFQNPFLSHNHASAYQYDRVFLTCDWPYERVLVVPRDVTQEPISCRNAVISLDTGTTRCYFKCWKLLGIVIAHCGFILREGEFGACW